MTFNHTYSSAASATQGAERRVLRRIRRESATDVIRRAQAMAWWPRVTQEHPHSDSRYWWWFLRA